MDEKEEEKETKVFVGEKLVPLKDLEKQYAEITIAGVHGNVKVVQTLLKATKPLTRHDVAKQSLMSTGHSITILKQLAKRGYVIEFRMGSGRHKYYLLTEKGLRFSKKIGK